MVLPDLCHANIDCLDSPDALHGSEAVRQAWKQVATERLGVQGLLQFKTARY